MDIIRFIEKTLGTEAQIDWQPRQQADVQRTWANIDKARHLLGWQPNTPYTQGILNAVEWYLRERNWAREVATGGL